jgi:hypothetical protein
MIHRIDDAAVELYRKTSTKGHESYKQDVTPHKAYLPAHSELSNYDTNHQLQFLSQL